MIAGLFLSHKDRLWLKLACQLAFACKHDDKAFAVGCIITFADEHIIAKAYSRMSSPSSHAEQEAIALAQAKLDDLSQCVLYSSIQPCGQRRSHPQSCQDYIVSAGIKRVVYALAEPNLFLQHRGDDYLTAHGIIVLRDDSLSDMVLQANPHIPR